VYSQGDPSAAIFYIHSGMVILTVTSKHRRRKAVLAVLHEGDFFGEGCLQKETQRMSTAVSIGLSTITRLEKATFRDRIANDSELAAKFISCVLCQTARFKADLADHLLNVSEKRLARVLLMNKDLAERLKSGHSTFQLSQTTLANMVGTTRSRISYFMNRFREMGYIRYNGVLEIDAERLAHFLQS
jgi:CRP/FNR family cyclic AMP-dependent transcriptional regulator